MRNKASSSCSPRFCFTYILVSSSFYPRRQGSHRLGLISSACEAKEFCEMTVVIKISGTTLRELVHMTKKPTVSRWISPIAERTTIEVSRRFLSASRSSLLMSLTYCWSLPQAPSALFCLTLLNFAELMVVQLELYLKKMAGQSESHTRHGRIIRTLTPILAKRGTQSRHHGSRSSVVSAINLKSYCGTNDTYHEGIHSAIPARFIESLFHSSNEISLILKSLFTNVQGWSRL